MSDSEINSTAGRKTDRGRRQVLRGTAATAGVLLAQAGLGRSASAQARNASPVVDTSYGRVAGRTIDGVHAFKGIPYGASTADGGRFVAPQPPRSWRGTRDMLDYGPRCPQVDMPRTAAWASWYVDEKQSEDCLTLNVWTSGINDGRKRPVMVWMHGGGFAVSSAGGMSVYDGTRLARRGDVVVVTVNHRLNLFGYLYLTELGDERFRDSGNVGQLDLAAALRWVEQNIDRFGGDPGRVMIFGESGGGAKVSTLMAMPAVQGLFHRAAVQSGAGLQAISPHRAHQAALRVLSELNIPENKLDRLQRVSTGDLLKALGRASADPSINWGPVVDGQSLPRHPFMPDSPAISNSVPLLVGYTKDETSLLGAQPGDDTLDFDGLQSRLEPSLRRNTARVIEIYRRGRPQASASDLYYAITSDAGIGWGAIVMAERRAETSKFRPAAPAYLYRIEYATVMDGGHRRSPHTLDLPLVFDNIALSTSLIPAAEAARAQQVADVMTAAWVAFAATGDPNASNVPQWNPYDIDVRSTMIFDVQSRSEDDPRRDERLAFATLPQGGN